MKENFENKINNEKIIEKVQRNKILNNLLNKEQIYSIMGTVILTGLELAGPTRVGKMIYNSARIGNIGFIGYITERGTQIKEYLISLNPYKRMNNNYIEQNLINTSEEIKEKILNNQEIVKENLGIYGTYISPYITIENIIYIGTFVIMSGITYYFFNYYLNSINDSNNYNLMEQKLIEKINESSNSNLMILINDLALYDEIIKKNYGLNLTLKNIELLNYIKQMYENEFTEAYLKDAVNLNFKLDEYEYDSILKIYFDKEIILKKTVEFGNAVIMGSLGVNLVDTYGLPKDLESSIKNLWIQTLEETNCKNIQEYEEKYGNMDDIISESEEDLNSTENESKSIYDKNSDFSKNLKKVLGKND